MWWVRLTVSRGQGAGMRWVSRVSRVACAAEEGACASCVRATYQNLVVSQRACVRALVAGSHAVSCCRQRTALRCRHAVALMARPMAEECGFRATAPRRCTYAHAMTPHSGR